MDFDDAAINHGMFHIRLTADFLKDSDKAPCFAPAAVTLEHAIPFAKFLGQIPLQAAGADYPQHGFYKHAVIGGWSAIVSLARTQGLNSCPLGIG